MSVRFEKVYKLQIKDKTIELTEAEANQLYGGMQKVLGKFVPTPIPRKPAVSGTASNKILEVVKEAKTGITAKEVSDKSGYSLHHAYAVLDSLKNQDKIIVRKVGRTKIFYPKKEEEKPSPIAVLNKSHQKIFQTANENLKTERELKEVR